MAKEEIKTTGLTEEDEKKLESYKRQLENVRKEMAESGTYSSELANK